MWKIKIKTENKEGTKQRLYNNFSIVDKITQIKFLPIIIDSLKVQFLSWHMGKRNPLKNAPGLNRAFLKS